MASQKIFTLTKDKILLESHEELIQIDWNKVKTTPYHPMGNGLPERFNYTLLSMVGTLTSQKKKAWPKYQPDLVMAYNSSTVTVIQMK